MASDLGTLLLSVAYASVGARRFLADMIKLIASRSPLSADYIPLEQARWSHDCIRFRYTRGKLHTVPPVVTGTLDKSFRFEVIQ